MKKTRIGINGFGRIGSLVLRAAEQREDVEVVAINDPFMSPDYMAYMLRYDTVHGKFPGTVDSEEGALIVNGRRIAVFSQMEAKDIPWQSADAEFIMESTGKHLTAELCKGHIEAGARHVVIGAPSKDDTPMFVMGVNHKKYTPDMTYVSNASCTTNCLAPMAKALNDGWKIQSGIMCTIHAYTGDQMILDGPQRKGDLRRSRAGAVNIVPNSTGAAKAIGLVIPELNGKLIGAAQRVPTPTGSTTILNAVVSKAVTKDEINAAMKAAATESFGYNEDEIVSSDIIGMRFGSLFDATQTMVCQLPDGKAQVQVVSWYDNENSYVSQMCRTIKYFAKLL